MAWLTLEKGQQVAQQSLKKPGGSKRDSMIKNTMALLAGKRLPEASKPPITVWRKLVDNFLFEEVRQDVEEEGGINC